MPAPMPMASHLATRSCNQGGRDRMARLSDRAWNHPRAVKFCASKSASLSYVLLMRNAGAKRLPTAPLLRRGLSPKGVPSLDVSLDPASPEQLQLGYESRH